MRHSAMRGFCAIAAASASFVAWGAPGDQPQYQAKSETPEQIAAEMANSRTYDFDIAPDGGLVDAKGIVVARAGIADYLKRNALDATGYAVLWITDQSPPLDAIKDTVAPFGSYGFTKIVVRARPGVVPKPSAPRPANPPKVAYIMGRPDGASLTAGDPFPALERPGDLRPEPLPPGVRYKFASDASVIEAAKRASGCLLGEPRAGDAPLFARPVMVQPGAWKWLKGADGLGEAAGKPVYSLLRTRSGSLRLEGMLVTQPAEKALLEGALRAMIKQGGGGRVRALRRAEMARWWPFISFDIVEPTLVVETADGGHQLILIFEDGSAVGVDDLSGLPDPRA